MPVSDLTISTLGTQKGVVRPLFLAALLGLALLLATAVCGLLRAHFEIPSDESLAAADARFAGALDNDVSSTVVLFNLFVRNTIAALTVAILSFLLWRIRLEGITLNRREILNNSAIDRVVFPAFAILIVVFACRGSLFYLVQHDQTGLSMVRLFVTSLPHGIIECTGIFLPAGVYLAERTRNEPAPFPRALATLVPAMIVLIILAGLIETFAWPGLLA